MEFLALVKVKTHSWTTKGLSIEVLIMLIYHHLNLHLIAWAH